MALQNNYLHNVMGNVVEILLPYKAIVSFKNLGKQERALLKADKLIENGKYIPMGEIISEHVKEGSTVKFTCHNFDQSGQDQCSYFITMAWRQDPNDMFTPGFDSTATVCSGLYNASGFVTETQHRQGVITYTDCDDKEHNILFLASKVYIFGKRLNTKQSLQALLSVEDKVYFDAIPCVPNENDKACQWFARLVWKGKKPRADYDIAVKPETKNLLTEIKNLTSNPKSEFVHGEGQILQILNEEFGIALFAVRGNNFESVLFHRSACFLFKVNLAAHDLTQIFEEGDKIHCVVTRAPKRLIAQWVASQIGLRVSKDLESSFLIN